MAPPLHTDHDDVAHSVPRAGRRRRRGDVGRGAEGATSGRGRRLIVKALRLLLGHVQVRRSRDSSHGDGEREADSLRDSSGIRNSAGMSMDTEKKVA